MKPIFSFIALSGLIAYGVFTLMSIVNAFEEAAKLLRGTTRKPKKWKWLLVPRELHVETDGLRVKAGGDLSKSRYTAKVKISGTAPLRPVQIAQLHAKLATKMDHTAKSQYGYMVDAPPDYAPMILADQALFGALQRFDIHTVVFKPGLPGGVSTLEVTMLGYKTDAARLVGLVQVCLMAARLMGASPHERASFPSH